MTYFGIPNLEVLNFEIRNFDLNFGILNFGIPSFGIMIRILEFWVKFWYSDSNLEIPSFWMKNFGNSKFHLLNIECYSKFLVAVATQYLLGSVHVSVCLCVASKFCIVNDSPGRWLPPKRKPKWKMTSPKMEDNLIQNGRRPHQKWTMTLPKMEDGITQNVMLG